MLKVHTFLYNKPTFDVMLSSHFMKHTHCCLFLMAAIVCPNSCLLKLKLLKHLMYVICLVKTNKIES